MTLFAGECWVFIILLFLQGEFDMSEQKPRAIVFIDGNNFYHNTKILGLEPKFIDFHKLSKLLTKQFNCNLVRSIYYNSVPSIKDGEQMYYNHQKFLSEIRALPNFEAKTRKLQRHSNQEIIQEKERLISSLGTCKVCEPLIKGFCSDCIGGIKKREKGIDVMIAVDMLFLSLVKNECDCCILISGDADFIPVMQLISSNNKKVYTSSVIPGYSYELRSSFKYFILTKDILFKECSKDFK